MGQEQEAVWQVSWTTTIWANFLFPYSIIVPSWSHFTDILSYSHSLPSSHLTSSLLLVYFMHTPATGPLTCLSLCLEHYSAIYSPDLLPPLLHVFAQVSPSQWSFPWPPHFKLFHSHFHFSNTILVNGLIFLYSIDFQLPIQIYSLLWSFCLLSTGLPHKWVWRHLGMHPGSSNSNLQPTVWFRSVVKYQLPHQ